MTYEDFKKKLTTLQNTIDTNDENRWDSQEEKDEMDKLYDDHKDFTKQIRQERADEIEKNKKIKQAAIEQKEKASQQQFMARAEAETERKKELVKLNSTGRSQFNDLDHINDIK